MKIGTQVRACFIAIVLWMASDVATNAAALRAEFNALAPRPRSNAPAPVEVTLHWQGAGLLEGVLELTLLADGSPVLRQRSQELALAAGAQTLRLLLPPQPGRNYISLTEAHLKFLRKKDAIDLGRFPVSSNNYGAQNFLIAVCGAPDRQADGSPRLWQTLRPDRLISEGANGMTKIATSPMAIEPGDLPASPLGLCAFDLVLLEGDSFTQLREKQLAALTRWIEAGGRLCVLGGGVLSEEHLRFLNQFTGAATAAPQFSLDESGHLAIANGTMKRFRAELGRIVVAKNPPETEKDAAWLEAATFLWNRPVDEFTNKTAIGAPPINITAQQRAVAANWQQRNGNEQRRESVRTFLNRLLPQSTQLIPLSVVAAILGTFVLVVGPGDWFVLGWIKRRRWTWFTFPIVATAFTALTVTAAEHYLGVKDARAALIITDVGRGGRVLRESRLELLFAARDKEANTELRQSLAAPTAFGMRQYWMAQSPAGPPLYEGQFPARAVLRQRLQQWTPRINRLLTFETTEDKSGIRWDAISAKELAAKPNPTRWFEERAGAPDFAFAVIHQGQLKDPLATSHPDFPFLDALSILPRDGDRPALPALAPSGDPDLSDLALIAHDDAETWLVTAIKRTPGEIRVYRRIYRTDE